VPKTNQRTSGRPFKVNTLIKTLMISGLLLIVVFVAAKSFGADTFTVLGDAISSFFGSARDWDQPYGLNYEDVIDMKPYGSGLAVLTNTEVIYIDSSSNVKDRRSHNYKAPAMKIEGARLLLFDRQSEDYRIEKDSGIVFDSSAESTIITAEIGKRGRCAIAHRGDYATSVLSVYNSVNELIFKWSCEKEHIVDIALSDNGKRVAVAVLGAKDGEIYSKLFVFDIRYKDPIAVFEFDGVSLFSVEYKGGKRFAAAGDRLLCFVNGDKKEDVKTYSPYELCGYSPIKKGISALCLSKYGNTSDNEITVFDKKGRAIYDTTVKEKVRHFSASEHYVSVLLPDRAESFNKKGEKVANIITDSDGIKIVQNGSSLYILTREGILKHHVPSGKVYNDVEDSINSVESEDNA